MAECHTGSTIDNVNRPLINATTIEPRDILRATAWDSATEKELSEVGTVIVLWCKHLRRVSATPRLQCRESKKACLINAAPPLPAPEFGAPGAPSLSLSASTHSGQPPAAGPSMSAASEPYTGAAVPSAIPVHASNLMPHTLRISKSQILLTDADCC